MTRADTAPALRVLYVVSLFPCWSETFIAREISTLVGAGVDVRILSLRPASETLVQPEAVALLSRVRHPASGLRGIGAMRRELRMAVEKSRGDRFVLLRLARAGGIDEPPARRDDRCGVVEHPALGVGQRGQGLSVSTPADVGIAA